MEEILPDNEEILNPPFQSHSMKVLLPCNLNPMTFQWITTSVDNLLDVFERRTSTGSEVFSLLTCLDDIKFVFLSFFTVIEAIWLKICAKPPSKNEKRPLPCVAQKRCFLSSLLSISRVQELQFNPRGVPRSRYVVLFYFIFFSSFRAQSARKKKEVYFLLSPPLPPCTRGQ